MKFTKPALSILTFFVGISAAGLIGSTNYSEQILSNSSASSNDVRSMTPVDPVNELPLKNEPRFTATLTGDGFGWWQYYITDDGQQLVNGWQGYDTAKKARAALEKKIKKAERIVERIPKYTTSNKVTGERVVLINPPDENGWRASIIFYSGDRFIRSINAPSLELALEFEAFEKTNLLK